MSKLILSAVLFLSPSVFCFGYPYDSLDIDAPTLGTGSSNQAAEYYPADTKPKFGFYLHINAMAASPINFSNANAFFRDTNSSPISIIAKSGLALIPNIDTAVIKTGGVGMYRAYIWNKIMLLDRIREDNGYWELYDDIAHTKTPFIADVSRAKNYCIRYSSNEGKSNQGAEGKGKGVFYCAESFFQIDGFFSRNYLGKEYPREIEPILPYLGRIKPGRIFDLSAELEKDLKSLSNRLSEDAPIIAFFNTEVPVTDVISTNTQGGKNLTYIQTAQIIRKYNVQALVLDSCLSMNFDKLDDLSIASSKGKLKYVVASPGVIFLTSGIVIKSLGAEGDWGAKSVEGIVLGIANGYMNLNWKNAGIGKYFVSIAYMEHFNEAKEALEKILTMFANEIENEISKTQDENKKNEIRNTILQALYDKQSGVHFYDRRNKNGSFAADIGHFLALLGKYLPVTSQELAKVETEFRLLLKYSTGSEYIEGSKESETKYRLWNISILLPYKGEDGRFYRPLCGFNPKIEMIFNKLGLAWQQNAG